MHGDDGTRSMKRRRTAENRRAFCVRKQKQDLRMFLNCAFEYPALTNAKIMSLKQFRYYGWLVLSKTGIVPDSEIVLQ